MDRGGTRVKIAIDVMGGDRAPQAPVEAAVLAARERSDVQLVLLGDEPRIRAVVTGPWPDNISIVQAHSVIDGTDEPVRAVRRKRDSSLVMAAQMVRDGEAQVMLSAGNTGALVAAGLLVVGRLAGIERPALAPVLPTFQGTGVLLLDAGATVDATAENLVQFAQMGSIYSRFVLNVDKPRVGLLNIGTEESKGNALVKQCYPLLQTSGVHFVGNVEARDLLDGECDVVVCDGFVGNVVLKTVEGVGLGIFGALRQTLTGKWSTRLAAGVLRPSLRKFRDRFDYAEYGGAPFLGVAGGCIKAHGSSNARAWYTALQQAIRFAEQDMLQRMKTALVYSSEASD